MAEDRIVYRFEGDSRGLTKALGQASREMKKTGVVASTTSKQVASVGFASKGAAVGVATLSKSLVKLNRGFKASIRGAGLLSAGILAAGVAFGKFLQSTADTQNALSDLSSRTGVTTKTLAGLKLAAEGSGQDLNGVAKALKPLVLRLGQAAQGSKTAIEGFKAVGVTVTDAGGKLRSADDVLIEVTKNLKEMKDPTNKAAAAALAFGSAGTKIVQALGNEDLGTFIDAAEKFGMSVGPEAAEAADQWQRAIADLKMVMTPFSISLLKFGVSAVRGFSLGWVFIADLFKNLSEISFPQMTASLKLLGINTALFFSELKDRALMGFANAVLSVSAALSKLVGNDLEYKQLERIIDGWTFSTTNFLLEQRAAVQETGAFKGAFDGALKKAFEFWTFQNKESAELLAGLREISEEIDVVGEKGKKAGENLKEAFTLEDTLDVLKGVFDNFAQAFGNTIDLVVDNFDNLTKGQKGALMAMFILQKAAAASSIAIDTAVAIMKAAILPPPLNIAAAISIAALGATQAATVAAAPPPFHVGGVIPAGPGKQGVMINALPGESILNRETTARLGADGVGGLNSGQGGGGMVIEMVYKHRIFDAFVADNLAKGGPLKQATKQGRRVGHRNG